MTQVLILLAVVVAVAALSLWWRSRDGVIQEVSDRFTDAELSALGRPAGQRVLVEFTAPSCAPCTAARRVLETVAADRDDVSVRVVDVGDELELARAHGVLRTPTTFAVAADGAVLGRVAGVPEPEAIAALLDASAPRDRRRAA